MDKIEKLIRKVVKRRPFGYEELDRRVMKLNQSG
jgi:hypothetical protein